MRRLQEQAASKVGELELGHLYLHKMFWNSPRNGNTYQQSQISGPRRMDGRTTTKCTEMGKRKGEQVLGGKASSRACSIGVEDREFHQDEVRVKAMGDGGANTGSIYIGRRGRR